MQPIHKLVEVLSDRGQRGLDLERVYRHICREDLLIEAYAKIGKNDGATTPGVDGETVDGMSLDKIRCIAQILRDGDWIWKPVRRIHIPKKRGGTRPLGIPSWSDKLVQQMIKFILELYYEPQFSSLSFGFRTGLGCHDALHQREPLEWNPLVYRGRHFSVFRQHRPRGLVVDPPRKDSRQSLDQTDSDHAPGGIFGRLGLWEYLQRFAAGRCLFAHPFQYLPGSSGPVRRAGTSSPV